MYSVYGETEALVLHLYSVCMYNYMHETQVQLVRLYTNNDKADNKTTFSGKQDAWIIIWNN